ncbi:MAG TPA: rhodoquinone biosynthesis methyltransferase RquA [Burkholderiaceae bacterium]|nr:rhodoquinone biosynthesis methyltransferase RquA [Burkholderiaceae bacterium]
MARYPIERSLRVAVEERGSGEALVQEPAVPTYLQQVYWWAYVHPNAVHVFEREWLVNAILFGNYGRLRDAALADLGATVQGNTLQVACAYGNLTARLQQRLAGDARLDVVDILPIQLQNLAAKVVPDERLCLVRGDSAALACGDACYDQVLLFFLLHEQPEHVRRATLSEALRVVKPGGKVIVVDYHQPSRWHPMRSLMRLVFAKLEPYAMDLWHHEVAEFMPRDVRLASMTKRTYFGGLYQKLVLIR